MKARGTATAELAEALRRVREKHDARLREVPEARRYMHAAYGLAFEPSCPDPECLCNGPAVIS